MGSIDEVSRTLGAHGAILEGLQEDIKEGKETVLKAISCLDDKMCEAHKEIHKRIDTVSGDAKMYKDDRNAMLKGAAIAATVGGVGGAGLGKYLGAILAFFTGHP